MQMLCPDMTMQYSDSDSNWTAIIGISEITQLYLFNPIISLETFEYQWLQCRLSYGKHKS